MADIQYLNYGDLQIELLALLNKLADLVLGYVLRLPWSGKRKEKFMSAYTDIINRGIIGASNTTGLWMIEVNGLDLNLDLKSKMDLEMYKEAAYFIRKQMSTLPFKKAVSDTSTNASNSAEVQIPDFDTSDFIKTLKKNISGDIFGTFDFDISRWNNLDKERNEAGERLRSRRAEILKNHLQKFSKQLTENKYNFTKSPFGTYENFKTRLDNAILALSTSDISDDEEALNKIGLRESEWFDTGLKDTFINDYGEEMTYALKALQDKALKKLEEEKAQKEAKEKFEKQKEDAAKALASISRYKAAYGYRTSDNVFKISDFASSISDVDELENLIRKDFSNIKTNDEFNAHANKILGAYIILNNNKKLRTIHNDIWRSLQTKQSNKTKAFPFKDRRLSDFKILEGIDNIVLDVKDNKIWFLDTNKMKELDSVLKYRKWLDELRKKHSYIISPSTGTIYYP